MASSGTRPLGYLFSCQLVRPLAVRLSDIANSCKRIRLSRRTKWAIGGGCTAAAGIIIVLSVGIVDPTPPPSGATSQSETSSSKMSSSSSAVPHHAGSPSKEGIEKSAEGDATTGPAASGPNTVSIFLEGAPEGSEVKANGVVSTLPLRLPRSSEIITVTVTAEGYKRWRRRIVPDKERHLRVRMARLKGTGKKRWSTAKGRTKRRSK